MDIQKKRTPDRCMICGEEIRQGTVFVLTRYTLANGRMKWQQAHLWCHARQEQQEKQRKAAALLPS